jgi:hypothetical protein
VLRDLDPDNVGLSMSATIRGPNGELCWWVRVRTCGAGYSVVVLLVFLNVDAKSS